MAVGSRPLVPSRLAKGGVVHGGGRTPTTRIAGFVALMKLRVVELLLITTVPVMVLAEKGWPSTDLVLITLLGGTLAAGGANAVNMVVDRDIDALMPRTQGRPLVTGLVSPREAMVFASSATLMMRPVGAIVFGLLADRFGRRTPLMLNVIMYASCSVACAFAPSFHSFAMSGSRLGVSRNGSRVTTTTSGTAAAMAAESAPGALATSCARTVACACRTSMTTSGQTVWQCAYANVTSTDFPRYSASLNTRPV